METYKLIVEYDGTRYKGFKSSRKGNTASIQDKLEAVLSRFEGREGFVLAAAVNTEPGVHSMGQVVSYQTSYESKPDEVRDYLNQYLPGDIVVRQVTTEKKGFRADLAKKGLQYVYRIQTGEYRNVREQAYMEYEEEPLDVLTMEAGARLLVGTVDLAAFNHNRKLKKSTVRNITSLQIQVDKEEIKILCQIDDAWPGLMPAIYGTLLSLGKGQLTTESMQELLRVGELSSLYHPAPVKGLHLIKVWL